MSRGGRSTGIGDVGFVALDLVRDVFAALAELLHILGQDGFVACVGHYGIVQMMCFHYFSVAEAV